MCFSTTASFGVSALLASIGIVSIRLAPTRALRLFAATPLIFAAQQASEGVIWLNASHPSSAAYVGAAYFFIGIAQLFWPVWIPAIMLNLEYDVERKKLLILSLACGALFSTYSLGYLILYGATAETSGNHIAYTYPTYPSSAAYYLAASIYGIAVIMPCLISSVKRMWLVGVALFGSALMSRLYYPAHFASVWCFCGAVISATALYIIVVQRNKKPVR